MKKAIIGLLIAALFSSGLGSAEAKEDDYDPKIPTEIITTPVPLP